MSRVKLCLLLVALGCPSCKSDPPVTPYSHDIENLCNVSALSGADASDPVGRMVTTAKWLGENLKTDEARTFLVTIQPLEGAAKADALDAEAHKLGIAPCAIAAEWRH